MGGHRRRPQAPAEEVADTLRQPDYRGLDFLFLNDFLIPTYIYIGIMETKMKMDNKTETVPM